MSNKRSKLSNGGGMGFGPSNGDSGLEGLDFSGFDEQLFPTSDVRIERRKDGTLTYGSWQLTRTGLIAPEAVEHDDYSELGRVLLKLSGSIQWLLGDWLCIGDNREWGETYEAVADELGYDVKTLQNYASVCRRVETSRRREVLSFGHHDVIAPYADNPDIQSLLLADAAEKGMSVKTFRQHIKAYKPLVDRAVLEGWSEQEYIAAEASYTLETAVEDDHEHNEPFQKASKSLREVRKLHSKVQNGDQLSDVERTLLTSYINDVGRYLETLRRELGL
ncbi:MAG: hypothetical protein AAF787_13645 [Chloroflexota bacterium]